MSRKLRVAQILSLDAPGGTELMGLSVFPRLDHDRFEIEVVSVGRPSELGRRFAAAGLSIHYLDNRIVTGLVRVAKSGRYDIAHLYGFRVSVLGRLCFWLASRRTKRLVGLRALYPYDRFVTGGWKSLALDRFERTMIGLTHGYIANSRGGAKRLTEEGVPSSKVAYVPNGIEVSEWPESTEAKTSNPPLILCVARFVPVKRHGDLIEALALVAKEADFLCRLVGSGPLERDLVAQVRRLGLHGRVEFAGQLSEADVRRALQVADIFVLTSQNEGMPRSIMEAMACGLPVVATDVNGSRELVLDSRTGYLVRLGDPQSIANGLSALLLDRNKRSAMGTAGRKRIVERFSLDVCVRAVEQSYLTIYEGRGLPGPVLPASGAPDAGKG